jgi:hypothetical protein
MSGVLFIGETERAAIATAVLTARAQPIPWSQLKDVVTDDRDNPGDTLLLEQRRNAGRIGKLHRQYPPQHVQLGTYSIAFSFEEQPAGLLRHISIASRDPAKVPNEQVVKMVIEAFGFSGWPPSKPYRVWVEEFEPGHMAINLAEAS